MVVALGYTYLYHGQGKGCCAFYWTCPIKRERMLEVENNATSEAVKRLALLGIEARMARCQTCGEDVVTSPSLIGSSFADSICCYKCLKSTAEGGKDEQKAEAQQASAQQIKRDDKDDRETKKQRVLKN